MTNPLYDGLVGAKRSSGAPFLERQDGSVLSYADFFDLASQYANALKNLDLQPGDRLVMQVAKSVEALAVYIACVQSGVVLLPLNTAYTAEELDYFVGDATPALIVGDPATSDSLSGIALKHSAAFSSLDADGDGSLAEAALRQDPSFEPVPRKPDDLAALLYTSGTTGRSKGAMLTHENLISNAQTLSEIWRFTPRDVLLHALPIFHVHGLFVASNVTMVAGGSMIFLPGFKIDEMIKHLPDATSMMGVPTFYTRLLDDERLTRSLVENVRLFVSGSAPLLAETHQAFTERTGHNILERYGMTETGMITSNLYDGERRAGYVGQPLPDVAVRVVDPETGNILAPGEIGVLEVKGPNVFAGYWNMPEKTAEEFREDGYFITGDMGQIDERGDVQIIGRSKDLIISGGYNTYPKEIELLLDEQPGVVESAVIGVPHPDFGEGVVAVVVAEAGVTLDPTEIAHAIEPRIARFKQPKAIFVVDELPRNAMGKVQKAALRDAYADCLT